MSTATKSRPIRQCDWEVRAILDGRKTQTRRVVKGVPDWCLSGDVAAVTNGAGEWAISRLDPNPKVWPPDPKPGFACPTANTETNSGSARRGGGEVRYVSVSGMLPRDSKIAYRADEPIDRPIKWSPSIHMPRWASRITLTVKAVRVERLQDISEADAYAEGVELTQQSQGLYYKHPSDQRMTAVASLAFQWLWDSINGPDSWDANPLVLVVEFERKQ